MDDYLKLKLDKLSDDKKNKVLEYLLGVTKHTHLLRQKEFEFEPMSAYTKQAKVIAENWGKFQGMSTGYRTLDKLTKGLVSGELIVVAARTSIGKTALAVNVANKVALAGTPVLFVTLEMTKPQLTSRYLYLNGGETEDYLKASELTVFHKTDELNWKSIDGLIGNFCTEYTNGFVVIDHLHYFTRELDKIAEELGRLTMEFKKNAMRHEVPIMLISHVRKGSGTVTMDDLRGSSYIAQDADIVLLCGRSEDGSLLGVTVEKNRNRGFDYKYNEVQLKYDKTKITEVDEEPGKDPFNE